MADATFPARWDDRPADVAALKAALGTPEASPFFYGGEPDEIQADNNRRARQAGRVVAHAADVIVAATPGSADDEYVETVITDLVGDLLHLCDALEVDWDLIVERALGHYHAELRGIL